MHTLPLHCRIDLIANRNKPLEGQGTLFEVGKELEVTDNADGS